MAVLFNTKTWDGGTIVVTHSSGANTWSYDTEIGAGTGSNLKDVADNFIAWGNHGDRPWTGAASFTYVLAESGLNMKVTIICSVTVTYTLNSALQAALNATGTTTAMGLFGGALASTLSAKYSFRNWTPGKKPVKGYLARGGSFTADAFYAVAWEPKIVAKLSPAEVYAESLALKASSTPRRAAFYDYTYQTYRDVYVGTVRTKRGRYEIYTSTIEALQVV